MPAPQRADIVAEEAMLSWATPNPTMTADLEGWTNYETNENRWYFWDGTNWLKLFVHTDAAGGDLTGTYPNPTIGNSKVTTAKIADDATTYAKMQNVSAASRLLGRGSAGGAGDPEEITLGTNMSMSGTALNGPATPTGTGFTHITSGTQDAAAKLVDTADINNDQVTFAKMQNIATDRLLGRDSSGTGDVEEIGVSGSGMLEFDGFGSLRVKSGGIGVQFLMTNAANALDWRGPAQYPSTLVVKSSGVNYNFPVISHASAFSSSPVDGMWQWRTDYDDWFVYSVDGGGWMSSEVLTFPFWISADQAATAYLNYGHAAGAAFSNTFGFQAPYPCKVTGFSLMMASSGTASVQVFGDGSAVGGTGDTLALSSQTKKSQWGVFSNSIAKDVILGVKVISGTVKGAATGLVHLRRFETT
jgi:hypothetical protein